MEAEQGGGAHQRLASSQLHTLEPQRVPELQLRSNAIEAELMAALERWEELGTRLSAAR